MKLADIKDKIEKNALSLATIDSKGKPHCIAVALAKVVDNLIVITNNYMTETPENIKKNPDMAILVFNPNWEKDCWGFELKGKAEYHTTGKCHKFIVDMPENKGYPAKGAIVFAPDKIKKLA